MVSVKLWKEPDKFWDLAEEWLVLLKSLQYKSVFLSPCWLGLTFDYFARDEELALIEARDETGNLVGIIPLVARVTEHETTLSFPSGHGFGHYDFAIQQRFRNKTVKEALRVLRMAYPETTLRFDLYPMSGKSPNIWALENAIGDWGGKIERNPMGELFYFDLPESVDEFIFSSLKQGDRKKFTKWVKRSHRLAEMEIVRVSDASVMSSELDRLFRIMQLLGKEKDIGVETFLRECALMLARRGTLELVYLKADSWPVAAAIVLKFNGVAQILIEDVDPNAISLQAGAVLFTSILESAIAEGIKRLELLDEIEGLDIKSLKKDPIYRVKAEVS